MENTLDDAVEKVLQDMGNLTREELLDEISQYMEDEPETPTTVIAS